MVGKASNLGESIDLLDFNYKSGLHLSIYEVTDTILGLWIMVPFCIQNRLFTDRFFNYRS